MTRPSALLCLIATSALAQVEPPGLGSKPGDLDGGQPFESAFSRCRNCHDRAISDDGDPLYLPFDGWSSTMMGNAVRDPLFQAAVSVANQDTPGIGSWCLRCHAPQSYMRGHNLPADGSAFDDLDREGVTCDVCHRVTPNPATGAFEPGNAQLFFDPANVKYGPYANIDSPAHLGADAGFVSQSALCGNCHQIENPLVPWRDVRGNVLGPHFPLDTTYDEWKQSQYASGDTAKSCQDCHMPRTVGADGGTQWYVAKFGMRRDSPRQHAFVGGNLWGLAAVQAADPARAADLADQFAQTTQLTRQSLESAAEISVSIDGPVTPGGTAHVIATVTNKTGHKLPTGYADGRRIVLQLQVNGEVHTGDFDGGDLQLDGWIHIYQALHARAGIGAEDHLALHDNIQLDSRIPPAGFDPPPGAATRPVGVTWFDLPDGGFTNTDVVTWDIDVSPDAKPDDPFDLVLRLLYQSTTPDYVGFLEGTDTTTDAGRTVGAIYRANPTAALPVEMARATASVRVSADGTGGGSGSGGGIPDSDAKKCGCQSADGVAALLGLLALRRKSRSPRRARP